MKTIYSITLLLAVLIICSCKKENKKQAYDEKELITANGIESNYSKISAVDKITIDPEVSSNKDGELEYLWGMYPRNIQLTNAVLDTICKTKKLDYLIKQVADDWILVFRVTNKKTGYAQFFNTTVSVGTQFTRGWYVIKDENKKTDLDLFLTPKDFMPATKVENVYSLINGKKLDGEALMIRFNTFYKAETNGVFDNTRTLFLVSDKDASSVRVSSLKEIRDFNSLIFGALPIKSPGFIGNDYLSFYMMNGGQLHSIVGQGPSLGQFGGRKLMDAQDTPYSLSKYHLMFISSYFFDDLSSTFVSASDRSLYLTPIKDNATTELKSTNNNKKLLYMGTKSKSPFIGWAIFQDKTNATLKTLVSVSPSTTNFKMVNTVLNPTDKIYNGSNFALLYQDENIIYFSVGREVWSRNLSNNFEQLQYTVPANETITFICHRKNVGTGTEIPYSYNYVVIGSKLTDNTYRVRMFNKLSGNITTEPVFTLDGQGIPKDVIYISPAVSTTSNSNPDTY